MKFNDKEIETMAKYLKETYSLEHASEGIYIEIMGGRAPGEVINELKADPQFRLKWRLIGEKGMEEWLASNKKNAIELRDEKYDRPCPHCGALPTKPNRGETK